MIKMVDLKDRINLAEEVIDGPHALGNIEVVIHGREELLLHGRNKGGHFRMRPAQRQAVQLAGELVQAPQGGPHIVEPLVGEVERLAVVHRKQHEADFATGVAAGEQLLEGHIVAGVARHILAVDQHQFGMEPVVGERFAGQGLGDGDLVLVVREDEIAARSVDIHGGAEIAGGHGRTFHMPAGPHIAPLCLAEDTLFQFAQSRALEQGEIPRIVLLIVVQIDSPAQLNLAQVNTREPPVFLKFGDIEIDRAMLLVGIAAGDKLAGDVDHRRDVLRGLRIAFGPLHPEYVEILHEAGDILLGILLQRLADLFSPGDGIVVDVGEVHIGIDPQPFRFHGAGDEIGDDEPPAVREIGDLKGGRPAGVEGNLPLLLRREDLLLFAHGVVEAELALLPIRLLRRGEERRAEIAFAAVGQNNHHQTAFHAFGILDGRGHGPATAHADQQALLAGQLPRHAEGVLVVDDDDLVRDRFVEDARLIGLLHIFQPLDLVVEVGLDGNDFDMGLKFVEPGTEAHDGAGGAERRHQMGHPAVRLAPDFRGGIIVMGAP
ncbi:MAG: hypothetical protein ACD_75C00898G0001, partial [uncultured bacterium]